MAVTDVRGALVLALPPARVTAAPILQAGAAELRLPTYVVGGFFRDLLLGRRPGDFDLVVQAASQVDAGAGPRLAGALARQWGGEVTTHRAFGTATWFQPRPEQLQFCHGPHRNLCPARRFAGGDPGCVNTGRLEPARLYIECARLFRVDGEGFGDVLDPYQGQDDLAARRVRVLHGLSFERIPRASSGRAL